MNNLIILGMVAVSGILGWILAWMLFSILPAKIRKYIENFHNEQ